MNQQQIKAKPGRPRGALSDSSIRKEALKKLRKIILSEKTPESDQLKAIQLFLDLTDG